MDFLSHYFYILIILSILYLSGSILFKALKIDFFSTKSSFSLRIILGLVLLVLVYSLLKTRGLTVNAILAIPGAIFLQSYRKSIPKTFVAENHLALIRKELMQIILLFSYSLLWLIWQYSLYSGNVNGEIIIPPHTDFSFYTDVINSLKWEGAENVESVNNLFYQANEVRNPYHYFELWLSAATSDITGVSSYQSIIIDTPVIFYTLISMILFTFSRSLNIKTWISVLCPSLIFVKGYFWGSFLTEISTFTEPWITYTKLLPFYLFILLGFLICRENRNGILLFFFIPIASITAAFSVFGIWAISAFYFLIVRRENLFRKSWFLTGLLIIICLGLYYYNFDNTTHSQSSGISVGIQDLKTIINILGATFLQANVVYLPVFMGAFAMLYIFKSDFKSFFRLHKNLFLLFFAGFASGLISWAILYKQMDAYQIFLNSFIAGTNCLLILISLYIINIYTTTQQNFKKFFFSIIFISFIAYGVFQTYKTSFIFRPSWNESISSAFHSKVGNLLKTHSPINPIGVSFMAKEDYTSFFKMNSLLYWPGQSLKLHNASFFAVSLSIFDLPVSSMSSLELERAESFTGKSPFYKWIQMKYNNLDVMKNKEFLQFMFMKEAKIDYIVCSRDAQIPASIQPFIRDSVLDSLSGIRFYMLNKL